MKTRLLGKTLLALTLLSAEAGAVDGVAVIAHPSVSKIDAAIVKRVFEGRPVSKVDGVTVMAVNLVEGSEIRRRFLRAFVSKDEGEYIGYWVTYKFNGLGLPPKELASSADVIKFVQSTPGAIGYIAEADVKPGMNVLIK